MRDGGLTTVFLRGAGRRTIFARIGDPRGLCGSIPGAVPRGVARPHFLHFPSFSMDLPIAVILNSRSGDGNGDSTRQKLEALFRAAGTNVKIAVATEDGLKQLAKDSARGESDVVVAGGGDGTIACVAAALLGTNKTLG